MGKSINGRSIRGMTRYEAIEAGLELQARFQLLASVVRGLMQPHTREYEEARELAEDIIERQSPEPD
jgi:hypothetical protein